MQIPTKKRLLIGITPRLDLEPIYGEVREALDIELSKFVIQLGATPVILSHSYNNEALTRLELDGVIFSGGNSLSSLHKCELSVIRDHSEKEMLKHFLTKGIPIIGLCRGMQFILHYFGEKLVKAANHVAARHEVKVRKSTSLLSAGEYLVNSFHEYGLNNIKDKKWEILAVSNDGIIEAVYSKVEKILCLMWHPEREPEFREDDLRLFNSFLFG